MKTKSEELFENFLIRNNLLFEKIEEEASPRPDYLVTVRNLQLMFEVKELAKDKNFGVVKDLSKPHITHGSRTVGDHVRRTIKGSKKQIQYGANQGIPSILLIYNNLDRVFQAFGTEDMDFTAAMYGEYTVLINKNTRETSDLFNGKNQLFQNNKNTSFSAVGRLCDRTGETTVTLFESAHENVKVKVPYDQLPPCFDVRRVEVSTEPLVLR